LDEDELDAINSRLAITESNCNWSSDDYPALRENTK
jgi:hypothetical protein